MEKALRAFLLASSILAGFVFIEVMAVLWQHNRATVILVNETRADITDLTISAGGPQRTLNRLRPGRSRRIRIFPGGESGITVSYKTASGDMGPWSRGYIEPRGGYVVTMGLTERDAFARDTHFMNGLILLPILSWLHRGSSEPML